MRQVIRFLDSILDPIPSALKEELYDKLLREDIQKKSKILRAGQRCDRIYFIEKGLLRCYVKRRDEQVTKWFMCEGDVVISVSSFFKRLPSKETIETLENSVVYSITFGELQDLYRRFPDFLWIGKALTEEYYCRFDSTADDLRMKFVEELYTDWLINHPQLIGRVTETHLASYLGITLPTLSRAKKKACQVSKTKKAVQKI